eukprot:5891387-Pyramimonas_sp.AAC.1
MALLRGESPNTIMLDVTLVGNSEQFHIDWGRSVNALDDHGHALMGQLQSLCEISRAVAVSSDDNAYYRPQGPTENGLRSMVDAWNAEASLWAIEAARQDWID